jgi:2-iminobutanoate/2-iminopropanoate deaminase
VKPILTEGAPLPAGHYSQAIVHGGLVYVSGQLPIEPASGRRVLGTVEEQTLQALRNVQAVLVAAGSDLSSVLKVTVYVTDIALWDRVNVVYGEFFGRHRPARAIVPVKTLHHGFLIEVEAIAALSS